MSIIYATVILLKPSKDYLKLAAILYGLSLYALMQSAISGLFFVLALALLLCTFLHIVYRPMSRKAYHQIKASMIESTFYNIQGEYFTCTHFKIAFDSGLFFLLISEGVPKKTVLIFNDQITTDEKRLLHRIATINDSSVVKKQSHKRAGLE